MTLMKWIHVFRNSGNDEDFVSSLTSATEMLPTTLDALSSTASDDTPSLSSNVSASDRGLSPLRICQSLKAAVGGNLLT